MDENASMEGDSSDFPRTDDNLMMSSESSTSYHHDSKSINEPSPTKITLTKPHKKKDDQEQKKTVKDEKTASLPQEFKEVNVFIEEYYKTILTTCIFFSPS